MKKFILLCLTTLFCSATTWAAMPLAAVTYYNFTAVNDNGVTIYYLITSSSDLTVGVSCKDKSYNTYSGEVNVPETVENNGTTYTVTSVEENAFYKCTNLTSVSLPNTIEYLDRQAFCLCESLIKITIPEKVETIGSNALSDCTGLTAVYSLNPTPPDCTKGSGLNGQEGTYDNFDGIDMDVCILYVPVGSVSNYSAANGWNNFKHIEEMEDEGTPLADGTKFQVDGLYYYVDSSEEKTVYVTYGGSSALSGTSSYTGDITVPEKVKYEGVTYTVVGVGENAFYSCALTSVVIPSTVTEIGNVSFAYCSSLQSVSLSEGLLSIGVDTFRDCPLLEEIDIPNSVTLLNSYAFRNCTSLKHATLSEGLTSIANGTFYECSSLEEIVLPKSITLINMQAFYNCTSLMSVTSPNLTPPETYAGVFSGVNTDECVLYVPMSAVEAYSKATTWQNFTHIVGIEDEVGDRIDVDGIFYNIVSTTDNTVEVTWGGDSSVSGTTTYVGDIAIPSTVNYGDNTYTVVGIGENTFRNCEELTSVTMTETVTYINEYAFCGTTKAAIVEIGSGVTTIGGSAFYESGLTEVTIPASVKTVGDNAFAYSDKLEKVVIEGDFTSMGAFRYCSSLKDVDLGRTTHMAERLFEFCNALEYITIPETVTQIDAYVFYQCEGLKEITIPDNVTFWDGWVVWTCTSLEKAIVGEGLTSTGYYQFYCCYALKDLTLGSNISRMTTGTCANCTSLEKLTSLNSTPPTCSSQVFDNVPTDTCILYVPKGSRNDYASASVWKNFLNIVEIGDEDTGGISGVSANGVGVMGYYTVDGQQLSTPQKGVNIIRYTDGTTKKILIK